MSRISKGISSLVLVLGSAAVMLFGASHLSADSVGYSDDAAIARGGHGGGHGGGHHGGGHHR